MNRSYLYNFFCLNSSPSILNWFSHFSAMGKSRQETQCHVQPWQRLFPGRLTLPSREQGVGKRFPGTRGCSSTGQERGGKPGWDSTPGSSHLGSSQTLTRPPHAPFPKTPGVEPRRTALRVLCLVFRERREPPASPGQAGLCLLPPGPATCPPRTAFAPAKGMLRPGAAPAKGTCLPSRLPSRTSRQPGGIRAFGKENRATERQC